MELPRSEPSSEGAGGRGGPSAEDLVAITEHLRTAAGGDTEAFNTAFQALRTRLHEGAQALLARNRSGTDVAATDLLHEGYLKALGSAQTQATGREARWADREHFVASVVAMMRNVLVDMARRRSADERGGDFAELLLQDEEIDPRTPHAYTLLVDDACRELSARNPLAGQLVELRYFGGLSWVDAGEVLGLPVRQRKKLVQAARAWLGVQLGLGRDGEG